MNKIDLLGGNLFRVGYTQFGHPFGFSTRQVASGEFHKKLQWMIGLGYELTLTEDLDSLQARARDLLDPGNCILQKPENEP